MKATEITKDLELQIIEHYKNNSARSTAKHFHVRPSRLNELLAKYDVNRHATVKTDLSSEQIGEIINSYSVTTDLELCKKFHITKPRLFILLEQNNIKRHSEAENRSIAQATYISEAAATEICSYYTTHNMTDTCRAFRTNKNQIKKILETFNISRHTMEQVAKIKQVNQSNSMKSYYQNNPDVRYKSYGRTRYDYEGQHFDSSWEIALWIFAKDHAEQIKRSPTCFEYYVDTKKHYYFPDFYYRGKLLEIKGDHMLKDNKLYATWKSCDTKKIAAKQDCIVKNAVEIWSYKDIKFALDYVDQTYGKNYLKQFRRNKKETDNEDDSLEENSESTN